MDSVQSMRVFARVAQLGGFSAAARDLRVSGAAVTKHVAALEERVGARLLNRTTRAMSLTEAGRVYLERCLECLQAFEDAEASVSELAREPRGVLRLSAPVEFVNMLLPPLVEHFMTHYPRITLDLRLSNKMLDLVDENIDVALRFAMSLEGGFVARPFATTRASLWASPDYLRAHKRPRRPEDLCRHRFLVFSEPAPRDELRFSRGDETVRIKLNAAMLTNSGEMVLEATCRGAGVALAPSMLAERAWRAGRIEPILTDWTVFSGRMFACYPHRRHLSAKVRAVLDYLRATYGDDPTRDPWWPTSPPGRVARP